MASLSNVIVADPRDRYWFNRARTAEERVESLIRERDDQTMGVLFGMVLCAMSGAGLGYALAWFTSGWWV